MTAYEQAEKLARNLELKGLFRRAAQSWGNALSLSKNKKQERECIKNGTRCIRKAKLIISEGW